MTRDRFDFEEDFHQDRKESRKERKRLTEADRSKFKKTEKKTEKATTDESLAKGLVVAITGEGTWVEHEEKRYVCTLKGGLKKEKLLVKNVVAVGDFVRFEKTSPTEGSIIQIEERFSTLARTEIRGQKEQLIAVNIDQVVIVAPLVEPPLKPALIDRYLIAAIKGNIRPIIAINKMDLLSTSPSEAERYREFLTAYEPLGFPIVSLSTLNGTGIDALRSLLKGKTTVFAGQSGVGKSSLLNAAFGFSLKTGDLAQKTFKGTHTTTTASLITLPGGGHVVDTPGIRSFNLWNLKKEEVMHHFQDLQKLRCRFPDCSHKIEPGCGVLKALQEGTVPLMRYESYCSLLDEAIGGADNWTKKKLDPEEE
ncbi:MAG TPA: ribosome small subunit-dependent GTPase A [Chlamydiales bacterium]|jgi:ribosome biogenesis GTPase